MASNGRMRVIMTVHGGAQGLFDSLEGLVQRNERSIREGAAPLVSNARITPTPFPIWRDAVTAAADGVASTGTIAAWKAGEERAKNKPARVALINGIPGVVYVDGPTESPVSVVGLGVSVVGLGMQTMGLGEDEGSSTENLLLTLDDDRALPVCEINTAIARHNAKRIRKKGLPKLYDSGVRYKVEGSPELWWDAEEILRNGFDDCEGLAAYRAADLMVEGFPSAEVYCRLIQMPSKEMGGSGSGGRLFHAVTRVRDPKTGNWVVDDPSVHVGLVVKGGGMPVPAWYMQYAKQRRAKGLDL